LDETVVSPKIVRRRLPRLSLSRLPTLRLLAPADEGSIPLIASYRRPAVGRWAIIIWLVLMGIACGVFGWLFAANAPRLMVLFALPPAVLMIFLIWALPAGDYAPTKIMTGLFWAFFIALILWPNYLAIALPGLPWLTLVRLINAPLVLALLICVSVSRPFRDRIADCLKDSPLIWKSLVVYIAVVTVTLPMAGSAVGVSINKYIILLTTQIATFFISLYIFLKPRRLEIWVYLLLIMDAILSWLGWWENRLGYVPWAGHIPSFLKIEDDSVTRVLAGAIRSAIGIHRVQSVQTTPLGFAELLGLSAPFALHVGLSRYPLWIRACGLIMLPVIVYMIILTDARLGFVALLAAAALYLLVQSLVRWKEVRGSLFGPAVVLGYPAIFIALVAATLLIGRLRAKVWGDGSQAASTEGRKEQVRAAIPKFFHNPIGHGYGTAGHVLGITNAAGVQTIDSYYLNLLLDTGLLGLIAYLTFFLGSAWLATRQVVRAPGDRELRLLMPLAVTLVAYIIVKAVLSQDANHPVVFFMAGAIAALIHRSRQRERELAASA
jgi:O-antigen ligase